MKNFFKRAAAVLLCAMLIVAMVPTYAVSAASEVDTAPKFRVLSAEEMVAEMGTGWNLGNTMDGHTGGTPNEVQWQSVLTTQAIIDAVHDYGFNTVRIPTTWGTMINDDYSINDTWMSRVQDIVDYCVNNGMYVIINVHHDGADNGYWLDMGADDMTPVYEKFAGVWNTIALRFKDYDEHLLFAAFNEIATTGSDTATITRDMERINQLNQIFVDTVRATGGNNAERWLVCPGRYTNIEITCNDAYGFKMPTDTVKDRLFVEFHYYDWQFGIYESMGKTTFSEQNAASLESSFKLLEETFISKGIPVLIGEYGSINKNNLAEREYHHEVVNLLCAKYGLIVPCYWDAGWYDRTLEPDYSFALMDRETLELVDPEATWAIFRGFYASEGKDLDDIAKPAVIVEASDITLENEAVTLTAGENTKLSAKIANSDSNDALVWKTSDKTVATVLNGGYVTAVAPGTATLTVASQSGSVSKDITVTVLAVDADAKVKVSNSAIDLEVGGYEYIDATLESTNSDDYVTYRSSDESVATVSSVGKVLAISAGTAYVTVSSASGAVETVKVTVTAAAVAEEGPSIEIGINVYYNDSELGYFNNECNYEETVTITGDGKYTLTFDCGKHLSDAAKNAGVTGLNNLTAVYLKDHAVTLGNDYKSHLESCNIMWNSVVVDGKALTVNQTEPKSAIKSNGQFDTNDPLNSWDGSYVDEVEVANNVLNIVGIENPQVITITFTISDLVFAADAVASDEVIEATGIETAGDAAVTLSEVGAVGTIGVMVDPVDAAGKVAFVSSDASVAAVTINGVDENGVITATVTSVGEGECTITAYTTNGLTAEFTVTCEAETEAPAETVTDNTTTTTASSGGCGGSAVMLPIAAVIIAAALLIFKKRA